MVIDVHLENKTFVDIQEDTPIFGTETQVSCMRILEEEFLTRYPLVTRQMEFFESRQQKDQLFSDWSSQLRALGDEAALNELTTEGIYIMRYLTGVADEKLREKFLKETQPTIDLLDKIAHQHEVAASSIRSMGGGAAEVKKVNTQRRRTIPSTRELLAESKCTRCGEGSHEPAKCPHKLSICHGCQTAGHLKRVCQKTRLGKRWLQGKQPKAAARAVTDSAFTQEEPDDVPPGYTSDKEDSKASADVKKVVIHRIEGDADPARVQVQINGGRTFKACADTGTTRTIISSDLAAKNRLKLYPAREKLFAAKGEVMKCEGRTPIKLKCQGITTPVMALVTSAMVNEMLISMGDLKRMKILPASFPSVNKTCIDLAALKEAIVHDYPNVFRDKLREEPMAGEPMVIHLKEGAVPTRCLTARSIPVDWQQPAAEAVLKLLDNNILQKEDNPTSWIATGFFVPKGSPLAERGSKKKA